MGKWGGREGPLKSVKPGPARACTANAPDVKSTKSEVRRARITCKFSITKKTKKGKEKRTDTA